VTSNAHELPPLFARRRRRTLVVLLSVALGRAASMGASVWLVRVLFDGLSGASAHAGLDTTSTLVALALLAAFDAGMQALERSGAERLGQDYVTQVRSRLFAHLSRVEPRRLGARGRGAVMLRFLGDLVPLRQWIGLGVVRITVGAVVATSALGVLWWMDAVLAGAVAMVFASGAGLALLLGRSLRRASTHLRETRGLLANHVAERLAALPLLRACGTDKSERRAFERLQERLFGEAVVRARSLGALRAVAQGAAGLATVAALAVGAARVESAGVSTGTVAATLALVGLLAPTFRDLGRVHETWVESRLTRRKLLELFALPTLPTGTTPLPDALQRGALPLVFDGASVAGVFERFDAVVPSGRRIAITGAAGSGKSTLLGLVARTVRADAGRVLVGGVDVVELARRDFRRRVGVAGPDLPLLRGSLRRNLRYRWRSCDDEVAARAIALVELADWLAGLPLGEETRISEGGASLSLGERRRVMLARAVLGDPGVLVLDEIDTGLDGPARASVRRIVETYPGTVLFSTSAPDFLRLADEVWRLELGRVVRTEPTAHSAALPCS
jgi:ABC-type multidrug transport system fused ATPase/permease subunit